MPFEYLPQQISWAFEEKGEEFHLKANALYDAITAKVACSEYLPLNDLLNELLTMAYEAGYDQGLKAR